MSTQNAPIIIKKVKKVVGGGHHGGAWKVAYADFVTAMMAFFLLMWLVSISSDKTLQGIAKYFSPTESISDKAGIGLDGGADVSMEKGIGAPYEASSSVIYGSPSKGRKVDAAKVPGGVSDVERDQFASIMNSIKSATELQNFTDNVSVDITNEGLRIQIMDSDNRPMFKPNTSELQPYMKKILDVIGRMIKDQPNCISISGHTAAVHDESTENKLDFWLVSSNRANEVRKYLTQGILQNQQVVKIVGRASSEPFDPKDPYGVRNIRVSVTLLNNSSISAYQRAIPE